MTAKNIEERIVQLNAEAMNELKLRCTPTVVRVLNEALESAISLPDSPTRFRLLAITYNNLGCYYQKVGDLSRSLRYLEESLELRKRCPDNAEESASTLLNISAVYTGSGNNREALNYALASLDLLRAHFEASQEILRSLIVTYYKVGKAYEALDDVTSAFKHYQKGYWLSLENQDGKGVAVLRSAMDRLNPNTMHRKLSSKKKLRYTRKAVTPFTRTFLATTNSHLSAAPVKAKSKRDLRSSTKTNKPLLAGRLTKGPANLQNSLKLAKNRLDLARLEVQYLSALRRHQQLERSA